MLYDIPLAHVLFLDIETVPQEGDYQQLPEEAQYLWDKKSYQLSKEDDPAALYDRAGIYAEFGKIVCISCGFIKQDGGLLEMRLKSFFGDDEKILLEEFAELLNRHYAGPQHLLCAHNGKEFDFPYIARRMLILGIRLPKILDIAGAKPWEIKHIDTMHLWKFGDFKSYTSLEVLAHVFGIPTPKDDINGADVARVYYQEQDLERIAIYCEKDVATTIQLLLRMQGNPLIQEDQIFYSL